MLLGAHALRLEGLELARRIAAKTGAQLLAETFPARMARGEGRVQVQLVPYVLEMAQMFFLVCQVMEHRGRNIFNGGGEAPRVLVELELTHECEMIAGDTQQAYFCRGAMAPSIRKAAQAPP